MEIRNNSNNFAFQARLAPQLKNTLKTFASQKGERTQKMFRDKVSQVATWGRKDSEIVAAIDMNGSVNGIRETLALFNESISKNFGGSLPEFKMAGDVKSLFKNFMLLIEDDIVKAEDEIVDTVNNRKVSLLNKAIGDKELTKEITGKANSKSEDIWQAIQNLPEDKVIKLQSEPLDAKFDIIDDPNLTLWAD